MAIQFHCPQGHLLQGDEAYMGMQTQCPFCGVMFLIPVVDLQASQTSYDQPESYLPQDLFDPAASQPGLRDFLDQVAAGHAAPDPATNTSAGASDAVDIHAEPREATL